MTMIAARLTPELLSRRRAAHTLIRRIVRGADDHIDPELIVAAIAWPEHEGGMPSNEQIEQAIRMNDERYAEAA